MQAISQTDESRTNNRHGAGGYLEVQERCDSILCKVTYDGLCFTLIAGRFRAFLCAVNGRLLDVSKLIASAALDT